MHLGLEWLKIGLAPVSLSKSRWGRRISEKRSRERNMEQNNKDEGGETERKFGT